MRKQEADALLKSLDARANKLLVRRLRSLVDEADDELTKEAEIQFRQQYQVILGDLKGSEEKPQSPPLKPPVGKSPINKAPPSAAPVLPSKQTIQDQRDIAVVGKIIGYKPVQPGGVPDGVSDGVGAPVQKPASSGPADVSPSFNTTATPTRSPEKPAVVEPPKPKDGPPPLTAEALTQALTPLVDSLRRVAAAKPEGAPKSLRDGIVLDIKTIQDARSINSSQQAMQAADLLIKGLPAKIKAFDDSVSLAEDKNLLEDAYRDVRSDAEKIADAAPVTGAEAAHKAVKDDVTTVRAALNGTDALAMKAALPAARRLANQVETYLKAAAAASAPSSQIVVPGLAANDQKALESLHTRNLELATAAFARLDAVQKAFGDPEAATKELEKRVKATAAQQQLLGQLEKSFDQVNKAYNDKEAEKLKHEAALAKAQQNGLQPNNPQFKQLQAAVTKAEEELTALIDPYNTALDTRNDARRKAGEAAAAEASARKAIQARTLLLRDLRGGPLSQPSPGPEFDAAAKDIIAGYADDPELASKALDLAQTARHPRAIAEGLPLVGKLAAGGFSYGIQTDTGTATRSSPKDVAQNMARNALSMGGEQGGDFFTRMQSYYSEGKHAKTNAFYEAGVNPSDNTISTTKIGTAYAGALGSAMVGDDGALKPPAALDDLRNTMQFHPRSLQTPLPMLVNNVEEMRAILADPARKQAYQVALNKVDKAPTGGTANTIVRKTTGKANGDLTAADGKRAVMAAMVTPFHQGQVGSCFATAPARKQRLTKPAEIIADLATIVTTGTLKKGTAPALPAITNIEDGENLLLRSWEYSLTTMAARANNSRQKKQLSEGLFGGGYTGQDPLDSLDRLGQGDTGWPAKKQTLINKLNEGLTFTYDPTVAQDVGADGTSSKGGFVLNRRKKNNINQVTETKITDPGGFKFAMQEILQDALAVTDWNSPDGQKILTLLARPSFMTSVSKAYKDGHGPWKLPGGGLPMDAEKLLTGATLEQKDMATPVPTDPPDVKTKAILSGMVEKLIPSGTGAPPPFAPVGVDGVHEMNALPNNIKALKGANATETAQKIAAFEQTAGAKAMADLDSDRAAYLYEEMLDAMIADADGPLKLHLQTARNDKPAGPIKAAAVKALIKQKADAFTAEQTTGAVGGFTSGGVALTHASKYNSPFDASTIANLYNSMLDKLITTAKGGRKTALQAAKKVPPPANIDTPAKVEALVKSKATKIDADLNDNVLLRQLKCPEIVIVDSNWGSVAEQTFFVIAPSPDDGKLVMWKKTIPGQTYTRADGEWLDKKWQTLGPA